MNHTTTVGDLGVSQASWIEGVNAYSGSDFVSSTSYAHLGTTVSHSASWSFSDSGVSSSIFSSSSRLLISEAGGGDTSYSSSWSESTSHFATSYDGTDSSTITTTITASSSGSGLRTFLSAAPFSQATTTGAGNITVTTVSELEGYGSSSSTTSIETTGIPTSVSSWTLVGTSFTFNQTQSSLDDAPPFDEHRWTFNTVTTSYTSSTGITYTVPDATDTLTGHLFPYKTDDVYLMNNELGHSRPGWGVWVFSRGTMADSITGRFTDLYSSRTGSELTISDYRSSTSSSAAITTISAIGGISTTTYTFGVESASFTRTYNTIHSPVTTTSRIIHQTSSDSEYLSSSYSGSGDLSRFLGYVKATSEATYYAAFTAAIDTYLPELHAKPETNQTYNITEFHVGWKIPEVYEGGVGSDTPHPVMELEAWRKIPPFGFCVGGNFTASALPVFFSVEIGLASGTHFPSQSILTENLSTVSAYNGVTLFPVVPEIDLTIPGAQSASYISHLGSVGQTASLAVTWTSTSTTTGTPSTFVTYQKATYTIAGAEEIAGDFYNSHVLVSESFADGNVNLVTGGYELGDNNLAENYDVRLIRGYLEWTEFAPGESVGGATFSTVATSEAVSIVVPGSHAIVYALEPILTAKWGSGFGNLPLVVETPFYL